ncbi:hypothetical protein AB1Y20_016095 [Prymnesium parvum]|uniref:Calmodulin n=1 Tax=Prymnesium parvum TaxID=97485 RepID=A0AB34JYK5_PRYPA
MSGGTLASVQVTIPRTEEVVDNTGGSLVRRAARTVFVVQVGCKVGGRAQQWQHHKRYGYFERLAQTAGRAAKSLGETPPPLPRRRLLGHTDPRYLSAFRDELQVYMSSAVELVRRECHARDAELGEMLLMLELPPASDAATWERRGPDVGVGEAPIACDGYLRKQGGWHSAKPSAQQRKWRQRWFVLTGSSLHYYTDNSFSMHRGTLELQGCEVSSLTSPDGDTKEHFQLLITLAGREVRLAADSADECREWESQLRAGAALPPSAPPAAGTRDKRLAQLSAERQQSRLVRALDDEKRADRTLSPADEEQFAKSLELLLRAQECGREWRGFSSEELCTLVREGGMVVQRFYREETLLRLGEAGTFFGVVLQGTVAVRQADTVTSLKYPGQLLGELALFNGGLRSADLVTTSGDKRRPGYVATMSFYSLERSKASGSDAARAVAEKLNALLARCVLSRSGAADDEAALAELYEKQRLQQWGSAGRAVDTEAALLAAQLASLHDAPRAPPAARAERSRADLKAPPAASPAGGGQREGGVALHEQLELAFLRSSAPPHISPGWHRYWCALAGSCLYLYTSPTAFRCVGVLALAAEASTVVPCSKHLHPSRGGAIQLRHVVADLMGTRYVSALLAAASWERTAVWAEALRAGVGLAPAAPPDAGDRCATLASPSSLALHAATVGGVSAALRLAAPPDLSYAAFLRAQRGVLAAARREGTPFSEDLETGLSLWVVARHTARRLKGAPPHRLEAHRAYVLLYAHVGDEACSGGEAHMAVDVHHWSGAAASADAAGAAAILSVHLLYALEGEAKIHCEEAGSESERFVRYVHAGLLAVDGGERRRDKAPAARRDEACCLWPAAREAPPAVLYHVLSPVEPPYRLNCAATPVADALLDEARGAFVLDVTAEGGGREHLVWGGIHLVERPAAPQRMAALLLAHNLHNREYGGVSRVRVKADGTYGREELQLRRGAGGATRGLSGRVSAIIVLGARHRGGGGGGGGSSDSEEGEGGEEAEAVELVVSEAAVESGRPPPSVLRPTDAVVLVTEAQVFVWSGAHTLPYQRWAGWVLARAAAAAATPREGFAPCRAVAGAEPAALTALFSHWPLPYSLESQLAALHPDGKVPAEWPLCAEELRELATPPPPPPSPRRELNVWQILPNENSAESIRLLPRRLHGLFRSDSCYMVLDTHVNPLTRRKQHILYFWMGEHADRMFFLMWRWQLSGQVAAQVPVLAEVVLEQHLEPPDFYAVFRLDERGGADDAAARVPSLVFLDCAAPPRAAAAEALRHGLPSFCGALHVGGSGERHACAREVPPHACRLNSCGSFVIQTDEQLQLVWHGKGAKPYTRALALQLAARLRGARAWLEVEEEAPSAQLWAALEGGAAAFQPQRLVTHVPIDPRLLRCTCLAGRWQVGELVGFGQHSLVSEHVYLFDAYNVVYLWFGKASRIADQRMARRFAAAFLEAAADGRPPQEVKETHEGDEPLDFTCYFHRWAKVAAAFPDPYARRLEERGRAEMFGRVVDTVYNDDAPYKDFHAVGRWGGGGGRWTLAAASPYGLSKAFLDEVKLGGTPSNDVRQEALRLDGVTVLVTSLRVDERKHARCAALCQLLRRAKVDFRVVDLAQPEHRLARMQAARALRERSKSEFDLLSLPLLFHDDELVLVGDERPALGYPRLQHMSERELCELLGAGPAAALNKMSRWYMQRVKKTFAPAQLPTLKEVEEGCTAAGRSGYLEKEGGFFAWERRFFVLTDAGSLYWFKDTKSNGTANGVVHLHAESGARLQTLGAKLSFELVTSKKTYVLRAKDGRDLADWLRALRAIISTAAPPAADSARSSLGAAAGGAATAAGGAAGGAPRGVASSRFVAPLAFHGVAAAAEQSVLALTPRERGGLAKKFVDLGAKLGGGSSYTLRREARACTPSRRESCDASRGRTSSAALVPGRGVPFGLLEGASSRGTVKLRFFCVRDAMLLHYEAGKAARDAWEALVASGGASRGGWVGGGEGGAWLVSLDDELWAGSGKLAAALDPFHPRGVVPLIRGEVQPLLEAAHAIQVRQHDYEYHLMCGGAHEHAAWLGALRCAQDVSAHKLSTTILSRQRAVAARDESIQKEARAARLASELRDEAEKNKKLAARLEASNMELQANLNEQRRHLEEAQRDNHERLADLKKAADLKERHEAASARSEKASAALVQQTEELQHVHDHVEPQLEQLAEKARLADQKAAESAAQARRLEEQLQAAHTQLQKEQARAHELSLP